MDFFGNHNFNFLRLVEFNAYNSNAFEKYSKNEMINWKLHYIPPKFLKNYHCLIKGGLCKCNLMS